MSEIGSPDAIAAHKATLDYRWLRGRQFTFALDCLYALVAFLCLLAWLRDRKHWLLFWVAGFSLAFCKRQLPTIGRTNSRFLRAFPYKLIHLQRREPHVAGWPGCSP